MPPPRPTPRRPLAPWASRLVLLAIALGAWLGLTTAPALARSPTRTVTYNGVRLRIPAAWPVIDLARHPATCVRFDRHAVYLGRPGDAQRCPAVAAGRTEALLVSPGASPATSSLLAPAGTRQPTASTVGQLVVRGRRAVVTASWNHAPGLIRSALGLPSLDRLIRRAPRAPVPVRMQTDAKARPADAAVPGGVYTGPGFDACSTPSSSQMTAWGVSPYRSLGVYIGGENMACSQPNLTAAWVSAESAAGWHLIPIFVGLQAPSNSCGCAPISTASAASEGSTDAQQAVADEQAIGLGAGNPVYLDMEAYARTSVNSSAVLAYLSAWTSGLHAAGYRSGVYGNDGSAIADLASQIGTSYPEPDEIWVANWNGSESTSDASISASDWADHQRLHQYSGAHDETYGGTTINIDGDYVDAATAAAGSSGAFTATPAAAPSLQVAAAPGGAALQLTPGWSGEPGIAAWQVVAGQQPGGSTWVSAPMAAGAPIVIPDAYAYYSVLALNAAGQTLGSSGPVPDPAHLALYGQSVFVPATGPAGLPVGCFISPGCSLTTTITFGRQVLARTGAERMPYGGGLVYAGLTAAAQRLLSRAHGQRFPVSITVRDASGASVTRSLTLTRFMTRGSSGPRILTPSSALRLIGGVDFVSHGWVGGLLVRCSGTQPCLATTRLSVGRQTIAQTHAQGLGRGQIGYLMFTLTAAGHRLLATAPGNQLPVTATVQDGSTTAHGTLALISY